MGFRDRAREFGVYVCVVGSYIRGASAQSKLGLSLSRSANFASLWTDSRPSLRTKPRGLVGCRVSG